MRDERREALHRVLTAATVHGLDAGVHYYQGMHDVAAVLLFVAGERPAYRMLCHLSTCHLRDCTRYCLGDSQGASFARSRQTAPSPSTTCLRCFLRFGQGPALSRELMRADGEWTQWWSCFRSCCSYCARCGLVYPSPIRSNYSRQLLIVSMPPSTGTFMMTPLY